MEKKLMLEGQLQNLIKLLLPSMFEMLQNLFKCLEERKKTI